MLLSWLSSVRNVWDLVLRDHMRLKTTVKLWQACMHISTCCDEHLLSTAINVDSVEKILCKQHIPIPEQRRKYKSADSNLEAFGIFFDAAMLQSLLPDWLQAETRNMCDADLSPLLS